MDHNHSDSSVDALFDINDDASGDSLEQRFGRHLAAAIPSSQSLLYDSTDEENDIEVISVPVAKRRRLPDNETDYDKIEEAPLPDKRDVGTCTETRPSRFIGVEDEDEEGMQCGICLELWENTGTHRCVALKCGHLFGESCIIRWIKSIQPEGDRRRQQRCCPQCKKVASPKDVIPIYAKRVKVLDNTVEKALTKRLEEEVKKRTRLTAEREALQLSCRKYVDKCRDLEGQVFELTKRLMRTPSPEPAPAPAPTVNYKLALEHQFVVNSLGGCRLLKYSAAHNGLFLSTRSSLRLFNIFVVSLYDINTYTCSKTVNVGPKMIRDLSINVSDNLLATTSMSKEMQIFDIRTCKQTHKIASEDHTYWSIEFDQHASEDILFAGTSFGDALCYDLRRPDEICKSYISSTRTSPVVGVEFYPRTEDFPFGGILVCSLTTLKFMEFLTDDYESRDHELLLDGPFLSMRVDRANMNILIQTRASIKNETKSQFILANLTRVDERVEVVAEIYLGSSTSPVITRPSQFTIENQTYLTGYLDDTNIIALYDTRFNTPTQMLPCRESVYDTAYISTHELHMMAALTDTKCLLYKINAV